MIAELPIVFCPTCGGPRPAETPPCADGHGDFCPDRACVECGAALTLDAALPRHNVALPAKEAA